MIPKPAIGFIGLGLMGQAMASNLLKAGFNVHVNTRTAASATAILEQGATWHASPADLAASLPAAIIIICVTDSNALQAVITAEQGLLNQLTPDTLVIDMGTSRFDLTLDIAQQIANAGAYYLDAPVSGGQKAL